MTERAGNPESRQVVLSIDGGHSAVESDHRIQLEKSDSRGGIVEINFAALYCRGDICRNGVGIDFKADGESHRRTDGSLNDFVHARCVCPELLVTEGVKSEYLTTSGKRLRGEVVARRTSSSRSAG